MNHTITISCRHDGTRYKFDWDTGMEKKAWKKAVEKKRDVIKLDATVCIRRNIYDKSFRERFNAVVSDDACDITIAEGPCNK